MASVRLHLRLEIQAFLRPMSSRKDVRNKHIWNAQRLNNQSFANTRSNIT